jgi:GTP1/Obg family GTP-binding protein
MPQIEPVNPIHADVADVIYDAVTYDVEVGSIDAALDDVFEAFVKILKTFGRTRLQAELLLANIRSEAMSQLADCCRIDWDDAIRVITEAVQEHLNKDETQASAA